MEYIENDEIEDKENGENEICIHHINAYEWSLLSWFLVNLPSGKMKFIDKKENPNGRLKQEIFMLIVLAVIGFYVGNMICIECVVLLHFQQFIDWNNAFNTLHSYSRKIHLFFLSFC